MLNQVSMDGRQGTIGAGGVVNFGSDSLANVVFYTKSVHDPAASRERGKPWYKAQTYVRIQHPGEKDYVDRPVMEDDVARMRWPNQWAAFERKAEQAPDGTPVECLFPESPEIASNLHSIAIHTVEQLAGLTAHGIQTVGMGATMWQQKAKAFLDAAKGGASMHRLVAKVEQLTNSLEVLSNQNAALKTLVDRLSAEKDGISPTMIPRGVPPIAQAHAEMITHESTPVYQMAQKSVGSPFEMSDEPLFIEEPDGVEGAEIPQLTNEPPRRGPGRPRKNF